MRVGTAAGLVSRSIIIDLGLYLVYILMKKSTFPTKLLVNFGIASLHCFLKRQKLLVVSSDLKARSPNNISLYTLYMIAVNVSIYLNIYEFNIWFINRSVLSLYLF